MPCSPQASHAHRLLDRLTAGPSRVLGRPGQRCSHSVWPNPTEASRFSLVQTPASGHPRSTAPWSGAGGADTVSLLPIRKHKGGPLPARTYGHDNGLGGVTGPIGFWWEYVGALVTGQIRKEQASVWRWCREPASQASVPSLLMMSCAALRKLPNWPRPHLQHL